MVIKNKKKQILCYKKINRVEFSVVATAFNYFTVLTTVSFQFKRDFCICPNMDKHVIGRVKGNWLNNKKKERKEKTVMFGEDFPVLEEFN